MLGTRVSCAKKGEPIEMPFGGLTHVGPKNNALDGSQDRANPFASARGDKSAMQPFAKLLWTHLFEKMFSPVIDHSLTENLFNIFFAPIVFIF